jgi:hypothetical protein
VSTGDSIGFGKKSENENTSVRAEKGEKGIISFQIPPIFVGEAPYYQACNPIFVGEATSPTNIGPVLSGLQPYIRR